MRNFRRLAGIKNFFTILIVLSFSFVFISCGQGPQVKIGEEGGSSEPPVDNGDWGIDFKVAPPNTGDAVEVSYVGLGRSIPSMVGVEFTIEAWVHNRATGVPTSTVFSRGNDDEGYQLFLASGKPYFLFKIFGRSPSTAPTLVAFSNTAISTTDWVHIAGVLTYQDHSGTHADGIYFTGCRAQTPHIDLYINGVYKDCGTLDGNVLSALPYNEMIGRAPTTGSNYVCTSGSGPSCPTYVPNTSDPGSIIIDDVRLWETARSAAEIAACKDEELEIGTGQCGMDNVELVGYWKLNEGVGETRISDWSLSQINGRLDYCDHDCAGPAATSIPYDCAVLGGSCIDPWIDLAVGPPLRW